jgi:hypothetical protein
MVMNTNMILGLGLVATDGPLGHVHDIYFDDQTGLVRHVVVSLGWHPPGGKVMIDPVMLGMPDLERRTIAAAMTREEIRHSPRTKTDNPVYKQLEERLRNFYEWAPHWTPLSGEPEPEPEPRAEGDIHLRSVRHLHGYALKAGESVMGHLADFSLAPMAWRIELAVIEPVSNTLDYSRVIPIEHLSEFDWESRSVHAGCDAWALINAPEYRPAALDDPYYVQWVRAYYEEHTVDAHATVA